MCPVKTHWFRYLQQIVLSCSYDFPVIGKFWTILSSPGLNAQNKSKVMCRKMHIHNSEGVEGSCLTTIKKLVSNAQTSHTMLLLKSVADAFLCQKGEKFLLLVGEKALYRDNIWSRNLLHKIIVTLPKCAGEYKWISGNKNECLGTGSWKRLLVMHGWLSCILCYLPIFKEATKWLSQMPSTLSPSDVWMTQSHSLLPYHN